VGRRLGFWRRFAVVAIKPAMYVLTRRDWRGLEQLPAAGGVIIVANHHSEFDPLVVGHFVYDAGRWPQFLAKASLFRIPGFGTLLRGTRQIPVYRGTVDAVRSLDEAVAEVRAGAAVLIYPEGTTPKQGELWPEKGKTGLARLFLQTGAPVVPVVAWGAQRLYDPRTGKLRPVPRTPVTVVAGPPVDLTRWLGAEPTAANLYAITDEVVAVLRDMLAEIRGVPAPEPAPRDDHPHPDNDTADNDTADTDTAANGTGAPR
jgi:1-acyl-sn-glycerol-3-phosphate acyltransferase